jgi:hypothetical protein
LDYKEIVCEGMDRVFQVAGPCVHGSEFWVWYNSVNILTSWGTISLLVGTLLQNQNSILVNRYIIS